MGTSTLDATAVNIRFSRGSIHVALRDGREISAPLNWFPRLVKASPSERANWQIFDNGTGIHWPDVDEDISVLSLLGQPD